MRNVLNIIMFKAEFERKTLIKLEEICIILYKRS